MERLVIGGVGIHELLWLAATDPATPDTSGNTAVTVVVAAIAAAATIGTALGPTLLEIIKNRNSRRHPPTPAPVPVPAGAGTTANGAAPPPPPPPPPVVDTAFTGLTMVEQAVMDYRAQRDDAMRRYYAIGEELDRAQDVIREQAVIIARLEAASASQRNASYYGRHGAAGPPTQDWGQR